MLAGLDPKKECLAEWKSEYSSADDMNRYILNSSKGLAELTKSSSPIFQFLHESVRDFLLKENGLRELFSDLSTDLYSLSHNQLKRCCQTYMELDFSGVVGDDQTSLKTSSDSAMTVRHRLTEKYPFLGYANRHLLYHADEAATTISQDEFVDSFPCSTWFKFSNLLEPCEHRHTSLLYFCAENNFSKLISSIWRHGVITGSCEGLYRYPLFAALFNGHRDAVRALLLYEIGTSSLDPTKCLDFGQSFLPQKMSWGSRKVFRPHNYNTPLHWALKEGHESIAEILVASKDLDQKSVDRSGRTALLSAAEIGNTKVVRYLLLRGDANVEATDHDGCIALWWASRFGHEIVVQQLSDHGVRR